MPPHRRVPKRGFTNIFRVEYRVVNVERLNALTADSIVNPEVLEEAGLLPKGREPVKILGGGEIAVPLTVQAHRFAASAKKKIEAAGGRAEVLENPRGKRSR
jgi:large subunit ribosomal protein L15